MDGGVIELQIHISRVGLYPPAPTTITSDSTAQSAMTPGTPNPNPDPTLPYMRLLSGKLDDFLHFSRQEHSQWLIDIAHDLCDPIQKRGSLALRDVAGGEWRAVNPTDPLIAATYLYDVDVTVFLAKISRRQNRSKTSTGGNASTMANHVKARDGDQCWVSRSPWAVTNSHICPKRTGDHLFRIVYGTFVSPPPPTLSIFDEICGITLLNSLNPWFDKYELGLRFVAPDVYECHLFISVDPPQGVKCTIAGPMQSTVIAPLIHGHRTSPPNPQHPRNPPPGLFRWHYLQCVIKRFSHADYRSMRNILYYELPLPMEGDSDDEGTDSEFEWPSAALDRGRAMQAAIMDQEERQRSVEEWITKV